ncbi:MAG: DUF6531 domain-containing protein [Acidimicrobiales bacterium]
MWSLSVDAQGASGGGWSPGQGGRVVATVPVMPGQVASIFVGGQGGGSAGGFNGGGALGFGPGGVAGGGATDMRVGGTQLSDRLVVGGGGGSAAPTTAGGAGGDAGGLEGARGEDGSGCYTGGGGGTQSAGGAGGYRWAGSGGFGIGGYAGYNGGAGGGGWYGGGGGGSGTDCDGTEAGGGGGSSYAVPAATGVTHSPGVRGGHGTVSITYGSSGPGGGGAVVGPSHVLGGATNPSAPNLACAQANRTAYPVTTSTGNFWHRFEDLSIPGRGMPLSVTRTYNAYPAMTVPDGPLGHGWSFSYGMALAVDGTAATVRQEDGSEVTFTDAGGGYSAPSWVVATLDKDTPSPGLYTFTRRAQAIFVFNSGGQLVSMRDLNGHTTTLSYADGRLDTVREHRTISWRITSHSVDGGGVIV